MKETTRMTSDLRSIRASLAVATLGRANRSLRQCIWRTAAWRSNGRNIVAKVLAVETRVKEVETVIERLEAAAETMARGLEEISRHWDAVYRAMGRVE